MQEIQVYWEVIPISWIAILYKIGSKFLLVTDKIIVNIFLVNKEKHLWPL